MREVKREEVDSADPHIAPYHTALHFRHRRVEHMLKRGPLLLGMLKVRARVKNRVSQVEGTKAEMTATRVMEKSVAVVLIPMHITIVER